jgi:membrane associated rhomboid family serine protease
MDSIISLILIEKISTLFLSRYNVSVFNFLGIVSAIAAFTGVWVGHVAVRQIEFNTRNLLIPIVIALSLGLCVEILSLLTDNIAVSAALGILGITLLWDSFEFVRQERRIRKGRAPANPNNPRHVRILQESPAATTLDWLKRDPRGQRYQAEELKEIAEGNL